MTSPDKLLFFAINKHLANDIFDTMMPFLSAHGYLLISPFLIYLLIKGELLWNDRNKSRFLPAVLIIITACALLTLPDGRTTSSRTRSGGFGHAGCWTMCDCWFPALLLIPCLPVMP